MAKKMSSYKDFKYIGLEWGEFMWTLRISIGDNAAIADSVFLNRDESIIFWLLWTITSIITCVVFLNFIVAEACASYTIVTETLEETISQQRAAMTAESEEMAYNRMKTKENYP